MKRACTLPACASICSRSASKLSFKLLVAAPVASMRRPMSSSTVRKLRTNLDMVASSAASTTPRTTCSSSSLDSCGCGVLPLASDLLAAPEFSAESSKSGSGSTGSLGPACEVLGALAAALGELEACWCALNGC